MEAIEEILEEEKEVSDQDWVKIYVYLMRENTSLTLKAIAEKVNKNLSVSAISQIFSRLKRRRLKEKKLDEYLRGLEKKMSNV